MADLGGPLKVCRVSDAMFDPPGMRTERYYASELIFIRREGSRRRFPVGYGFFRESARATRGADVTCSDQLVRAKHQLERWVKRVPVKSRARDKKLWNRRLGILVVISNYFTHPTARYHPQTASDLETPLHLLSGRTRGVSRASNHIETHLPINPEV